MNGKVNEYFKDGKLKHAEEYIEGKLWNRIVYNKIEIIKYEIKDGKGYIKEYYDGKLKYGREYINGQINGKVKEYFKDGKLKFKGEYKEGIMWNIHGYDKNGNLEYEIKNGKGYIKEYVDNDE